jgi:hypothetical protein
VTVFFRESQRTFAFRAGDDVKKCFSLRFESAVFEEMMAESRRAAERLRAGNEMDKTESKLAGIVVGGAVSGILSVLILVGIDLNPKIPVDWALPFVPGLVYSLMFIVVSIFPVDRPLLCSRFSGIAKLPMSLVFIVLTTGAYFAAYSMARYLIYNIFKEGSGPPLAFAGLLGGGVGSLVFALSLALFFPSLARKSGIMKVFLGGMGTGVLLFSGGPFGVHGVYFFIVAWQVILALIIAFEAVSVERFQRHRSRRGPRSA